MTDLRRPEPDQSVTLVSGQVGDVYSQTGVAKSVSNIRQGVFRNYCKFTPAPLAKAFLHLLREHSSISRESISPPRVKTFQHLSRKHRIPQPLNLARSSSHCLRVASISSWLFCSARAILASALARASSTWASARFLAAAT